MTVPITIIIYTTSIITIFIILFVISQYSYNIGPILWTEELRQRGKTAAAPSKSLEAIPFSRCSGLRHSLGGPLAKSQMTFCTAWEFAKNAVPEHRPYMAEVLLRRCANCFSAAGRLCLSVL